MNNRTGCLLAALLAAIVGVGKCTMTLVPGTPWQRDAAARDAIHRAIPELENGHFNGYRRANGLVCGYVNGSRENNIHQSYFTTDFAFDERRRDVTFGTGLRQSETPRSRCIHWARISGCSADSREAYEAEVARCEEERG